MLRDLRPQEVSTATQLIDSVDTVFDADPAVKALSHQFAENRVVVVQSFADFTVAQSFCISDRSAFFAAQVLERASEQITIAGVHRHDAVGDPF